MGIVGGKTVQQRQALTLHQQGHACPVCHGPIKPGDYMVYRFDQLVHPECGHIYIAPFNDGTPYLTDDASSD